VPVLGFTVLGLVHGAWFRGSGAVHRRTTHRPEHPRARHRHPRTPAPEPQCQPPI